MSEEAKLSEAKKKHYVDRDGKICPYCDSNNLVREGIESYTGGGCQYVECHKCGKSWTDMHSLTEIIEN